MVDDQDELEEWRRNRLRNVNLISKILIASGITMLVVGAFLILFVSTVVGLVFMLAGAIDLGMSVFIFKITTPGGPEGGETTPPEDDK
ncbi:MAG: DUF3040 domain-containing protein [Actinobacteria bacterium]|nr:DUF3040 domain-containing protein [Actinomycetota bacterium]MBU1945222.1 DUF3040 domain-containing protein [Actinomycetota bacterium]MBU2687794.1 DUF3040 domain-containing protein [Actinomycetota bacterium]